VLVEGPCYDGPLAGIHGFWVREGRMGREVTVSGATRKTAKDRILGLDLAGSPRRPTGFCVLRGRRVQVGHVFSEEDILALIAAAAPQLVAIDAPLALPAGRCCLLNT